MSEENLAIVQAFADRVNEQDIPGFLGLVDPEVEFHTFRGVELGLEGARRFAEGNGPREHYLTHVVHEQAFDAGDHRAGKVLRFQVFRDRDQALAAAGLTQGEQASSP